MLQDQRCLDSCAEPYKQRWPSKTGDGDQVNAGEEDSVWIKKGATLSDKSAREEYGLTQEEIIKAMKQGKLQYRVNSVFGNPFLRLIRGEVEALVSSKAGQEGLKNRKLRRELAEIEKALRSLRKQVVRLETRKSELLSQVGN